LTLDDVKIGHHVCVFIALSALIGLGCAFGETAWDFEADKPGQIAHGFTSEVGRWEVIKDGDNQVLAQRAENRLNVFNLALIERHRSTL
jgi:hypothetical protein